MVVWLLWTGESEKGVRRDRREPDEDFGAERVGGRVD